MSVRFVLAVWVSIALHAAVFWIVPGATKITDEQPAKVVQTVHLVYRKSDPQPNSRSSAVASNVQMRRQRSSVQNRHESKFPTNAAQLQVTKPHVEQKSAAAQQQNTNPTTVDSPAIEAQSVLRQAVRGTIEDAVPCQSIALPEQWTQLTNVWPRRYLVEFSLKDVDGREQILVEKMNAVGEPLAALDLRVRRAFADCILDRQSDLKVALSRAFGLLKPGSGRAYLQTIEFYPSSMNVASQQGT